MSKDFTAGMDSNARKSPVRIAFITRRTSAQVKVSDEEQLQTYPEMLLRAIVAIEVLAIVLVWISLLFNAPLEGLADPSHTPNPAKAPWIPYFNINVEAEGLFLKDRARRLRIFYVVAILLSLFLLVFDVYVALGPTLIVSAFMMLAAQSSPDSGTPFRRYLASKPLSYWIMTWFLLELVVLTTVGTFFRGPGWSWVWPWRS
ncbi:MAG: hypothetical protein LAO09_12075 [Acidobacteriia bacterium]|nr:hypothetical protein [Terriglobia bacterium]